MEKFTSGKTHFLLNFNGFFHAHLKEIKGEKRKMLILSMLSIDKLSSELKFLLSEKL